MPDATTPKAGPPEPDPDFTIARLGQPRVASPMTGVRFVSDDERVLYDVNVTESAHRLQTGAEPPAMETAGPRARLFFDPSTVACGIVTCGGLCPGLNDVIRSIVLSLHHHYRVDKVYGFRFGYEASCVVTDTRLWISRQRRSIAFITRADPCWVPRGDRRIPRKWSRRSER